MKTLFGPDMTQRLSDWRPSLVHQCPLRVGLFSGPDRYYSALLSKPNRPLMDTGILDKIVDKVPEVIDLVKKAPKGESKQSCR